MLSEVFEQGVENIDDQWEDLVLSIHYIHDMAQKTIAQLRPYNVNEFFVCCEDLFWILQHGFKDFKPNYLSLNEEGIGLA